MSEGEFELKHCESCDMVTLSDAMEYFDGMYRCKSCIADWISEVKLAEGLLMTEGVPIEKDDILNAPELVYSFLGTNEYTDQSLLQALLNMGIRYGMENPKKESE